MVIEDRACRILTVSKYDCFCRRERYSFVAFDVLLAGRGGGRNGECRCCDSVLVVEREKM